MTASNPVRDHARREFLSSFNLNNPTLRPLPQDASFRRYFRVTQGDRQLLLMDAPPPQEDIRPFVKVARHLESVNLRPPLLFHVDETNGFILLEDLGHDTFTRLLDAGVAQTDLYAMATDVLVSLHNNNLAIQIDLPSYDPSSLIDEALLLTDWYYPSSYAKRIDPDIRHGYIQAWRQIFSSLPSVADTLVLRDFHVDNLMRIRDLDTDVCALLDFQDALIGPPAYDLVSLLEDARRDLSPDLARQMTQRYFEGRSLDADSQEAMMQWYRCLGAQRHAKVLGIFVRLYVRDSKPVYLKHLDRVMGLLNRHLSHRDLAPLKHWLDTWMPDRAARIPTQDTIVLDRVRAHCGALY